jgi:hypothetical protein
LDETIKVDELLKIAPFVEHVADNRYSINVQVIEWPISRSHSPRQQ